MEESIVMLVRSNKMINMCDVIKENVCTLSVTKHDEQCEYINKSQLCLSILHSIPSCVLKISSIDSDFYGTWKFMIESQEGDKATQPTITHITVL